MAKKQPTNKKWMNSEIDPFMIHNGFEKNKE